MSKKTWGRNISGVEMAGFEIARGRSVRHRFLQREITRNTAYNSVQSYGKYRIRGSAAPPVVIIRCAKLPYSACFIRLVVMQFVSVFGLLLCYLTFCLRPSGMSLSVICSSVMVNVRLNTHNACNFVNHMF